MKSNPFSALAIGIITLASSAGWAAGQAAAGDRAREASVSAYAAPSMEHKLSLRTPGIVLEVLVKAGDPVKAGQLLVKLDDRIEKKDYDETKVEADSTLALEA